MHKMKRLLTAGMVLAIAVGTASAASLTWTNGGDPATGNGQVTLVDGWDVWLVQETGGDPNSFDYGVDTVIDTDDLGGGVFYETGASIPDTGGSFYVVYVNTDGGTPTMYSVADLGRWDHGSGNALVDFGGDQTTGWVLVPEPGAMALFALGCVTLAVAGRKNRR